MPAVQLTRRHGRTVLLGCMREKPGSIDYFYRDIQRRGITIIEAHEIDATGPRLVAGLLDLS